MPVLLGLGIAAYFMWPHEPTLIRPVLMTLLCGVTVWWMKDRLISRLGVVALLCIVLGFTAASFRAHTVQSPMIEQSLGPMGIRGQIKTLEQLEGGQGYRLILGDLMIEDLEPEATPHTIRLNVRKVDAPLSVHQWINVFAKLEPASAPTTPGGFDFRRHAYFQQIGGYGYVLGAPRVIQPPSRQADEKVGIHLWFENTRNAITATVNETLPPRQAGVVAALLTGERAAIADEDWQALRDSGLAHLLAISGANVDMVALIVFFLVRWALAGIPRLAERYPIKKYAAVAAFLAALFYVLLIFPSTPTWRAMLMITLVLCAVLLDRSPISLRLVAVTAAIILILQPEQLLSPSFQLSFAAVTALVAVFEILTPWLKRIHQDATFIGRGVIYVVGVCATTVIATLATAPISLYHFQTLALYGVLANALAVPVMTFLMMPLAILSYPLMALGVADSTLGVIGVLSDLILVIAHTTADLPGARLTPPAMPLVSFVLIVMAGLMICLLVGRLRILAVLPLGVALVVAVMMPRPDGVILGGGKVVMHHLPDGTIITNTRQTARRQQGDWIRYWGGDPDRVQAERQADLTPPPGFPAGVMVPIAVYGIKTDHPRFEVMGSRGQGRLWQAEAIHGRSIPSPLQGEGDFAAASQRCVAKSGGGDNLDSGLTSPPP